VIGSGATHVAATCTAFRTRSGREEIVVLPGDFSPLLVMLIERRSFGVVYVSVTTLAAELGLPDVGLITASDVVQRSAQIARVMALPAVVDADAGFGGPVDVALLEDAGAATLRWENQGEDGVHLTGAGIRVLGQRLACARRPARRVGLSGDLRSRLRVVPHQYRLPRLPALGEMTRWFLVFVVCQPGPVAARGARAVRDFYNTVVPIPLRVSW
jgi:hypothetical protein